MASLPVPAEHLYSSPLAASDPGMVGTATPPARLSVIEWSIVAMAERDGLGSIREPSRYTRAWRRFLGLKITNRLANERLETLRRVAVLAWHHGWNVPKSEVKNFFEAGFTGDQFELIQNSVGKARTARARSRAR